MTDAITNGEVVVEAEATATPSDVAEVDTETPTPRKRGRKPKVEAVEETKAEAAEEAAEDKVEDAVCETASEELAAPEELANTELEDATAADDEADNAALESADDSPKQILLTSRTPLYRGPSKASRISGASGGATVIGKVGEFTKISYVRRGIGVQEGYVILDA